MSLADLYKQVGMSRPVKLDFKAFTDLFVNKIPLKLDPSQLASLFRMIDSDADSSVSNAEFSKFFEQITAPTEEELRIKQAEEAKLNQQQKKTESLKKEFSEQTGIKASDLEKAYSQFMQKVTVTQKDWHRGNPTMFLDPIKALKAAEDFVRDFKGRGLPFFADATFGPSREDPYGESAVFFSDKPSSHRSEAHEVVWLRPHQICTDKPPRFFDGKSSSSDVVQGALGDCWFVSAMSVIAAKEKYLVGSLPQLSKDKQLSDEQVAALLAGVHPPLFHHLRQFGLYVFRFVKDAQYVYVITDDLLPCYSDRPEPKFASSPRPDLFWVSLVEKAYAKLHNCYDSIIGGIIDDGLVDMTGLVSLKMKINRNRKFDVKSHQSKEKFWQKLVTLFRNGSMMGCGIDSRARGLGSEEKMENGLLAGHAYSVQGFFDMQVAADDQTSEGKAVQLVYVRNPWGRQEWNGPWSDNSLEVIKNKKQYAPLTRLVDLLQRQGFEKHVYDEKLNDDGLFFMDFEDFTAEFDDLSVCVDFPPEYSGIRFSSQWDASSAGGVPFNNLPQEFESFKINPQFKVSIKRKEKTELTDVFISLSQPDGRTKASMSNPFPYRATTNEAMVFLFKLAPGMKKLDGFDMDLFVDQTPLICYRELAMNKQLENGDYIVIPATSSAGKLGPFKLSVYFNADKSEIEITEVKTGKKGDLIEEEEEHTSLTFDPEFKKAIQYKLSEVQFIDSNK